MDSTLLRPAPAEHSTPLAPSLPAGTVIADRFTLEALAGRGGMGAVYRATDSLSGQRVALKLLHLEETEALRRFTREAELLSGLRHPGIVAHVAHGTVERGRPFLAMEWLEGETLAQRLAYEPLRLEDTLTLLRRAAEALAVAHQQGVIHRDLKPSNLFLRQGHPGDVVLLDFGLARHLVPSTALTASQMLVGTPGHMAPEQVSGQKQLSPSADVFSLGCILYECLTGHPPFSAPHLVATLAKILFTEPTPLRELCPHLPPAFQQLLERMLAKDPARRLPDASSVLKALEELRARMESAPGGGTAPQGPPPPRLASAEQQLVTVLLASPRTTAGHVPGAQDSRLTLRDTLRTLLTPQGARVELLADGALVLTLGAALGSATDSASLAARCALSVLERWPEAAVVLTTGRGSLESHLPVGEAMDRAGHLLRQVDALPPDSTPVLMDEVTAGLLGPGFQLTRAPSGLFLLQGQQLGADASRPLLGKPTPCVGREQELALLDMAFTTCVEESTAQAVLVTAPAGTGKSRLRHEFLRRLERREPPPLVLLGRGDPMSAGSADGLLAQALRRLCGISGGEPLDERRARLSQRLSQHLPEARAQEVVEFLGELCAIPFPDEHRPRLRTARGDPQMMSLQVNKALVAFLKAECARHPVLLVLEDLHWGDLLSVRLMDEALRGLSEHPFLVLAMARPELEKPLPGPWTQRLQPVPLRGLSRKAGTRLVREVLGADVPDALVERLVEQAAGNALFLEELIRTVAEGRGEGVPETVLAMLQARLGRLGPEARQVLLAASLFGRTFWAGGVRALLGGQLSDEALEHHLRELVEQEWVAPQPASRFPGEEEYRFRHALVRDAAYALVPDSHKPDGHRLAGAWLERAGESDPRVLAEHASLGQQPERAIHFHTRAAEQHLERHDMPGTARCVEAALALGAQGAERVHLHALQAVIAFWLGDFAKLFETGPGVLAELRPGNRMWYWLLNGLYLGHVVSGAHELVASLGRQLLGSRPEETARGNCLEVLCFVASMSTYGGARQEASAFLARLVELCAEAPPEAPMERAWSSFAQGVFCFFFEARPWQAHRWLEQGSRGLFDVGLDRLANAAQIVWAQALEALGDRARAEAQLREGQALAESLGPLMGLHVRLQLALLLAGSADPSHQREALALVGAEAREAPHLFAGLARTVKAKVAASRGQLAEAEAEAREACELLSAFLFDQRPARTLLTQVLLTQGRLVEAREVAALGVERLERCRSEGAHAVGLYLNLAEACFAQGDSSGGEAALRGALQCLRTRADDIPDAAARERFLHQVPENARTLELARQRWGETAPRC